MFSVLLSLRKAKFLVFFVDAAVLLATIFLLVHQNVFYSFFSFRVYINRALLFPML